MKSEIKHGNEKIFLTDKENHFVEHYLGGEKMNASEAAKLQ